MMKKNMLCLWLAAALLVQCFAFGALAAPVEEEPAPTVSEPTAATQETIQPEPTIPDVPFGAAGVEYGCRTIDGQVALGGSEKLLKTAKGVFVYERNSDTILYNYNPDVPLAPGGLVQIVNAMVVLENCDLDETVTVSTEYINRLPLGARHVNLRNGEQISVRDLLYCMLVYSANDAAVVLAEHVGGVPERFINQMNAYVQALGCTDTVITTVSGLDDPEQHSTPRDLARILDAAMENEIFREIIGTGFYTVEATNKSDPRELKSMTYLLEGAAVSKFYDERVTGGKASYTSSAAGATVGFTAQTEELSVVCIIVGATRRFTADGASVASYGNFEEAEDLMDYCFDGFQVSRLLYQGQTMTQLEVDGGANDVVAVNRSNIDIVLPTGTGLKDLTFEYDVVGGTLGAPVKAGQEVATLQLWYGQGCVGETTLYAMSDVAPAENPGFVIQDGATRSDEDMTQLLLFLGVALLVILVPTSIYLIVNSARKAAARRRARKLRRERRDARMQRRRSRR